MTRVLTSCYRLEENNIDTLRFPPAQKSRRPGLLEPLRRLVRTQAERRGYLYLPTRSPEQYAAALSEVLAEAAEYEAAYQLLADAASRELMVALLAYRALGWQRVRLPTNNPEYWRAVGSLEGLKQQQAARPFPFLDWKLDLFDLAPAGYPVRLMAHDLNVLCTFLLEQYCWRSGGAEVCILPGDVVIDAGGCWGDTALYAASRVGSEGRVFCFEFCPDNLAVLQENLDLNPDLRDRVSLVRRAAWDRTGERLSFDANGPGTRLEGASGADEAVTQSIDDLVREEGLDRVGFIKMDIEGAELRALRGAVETLRRFRPRLAIAVYHQVEDFYQIPRFLDSLDLGYSFALGHSSIHAEETVLFARPRS